MNTDDKEEEEFFEEEEESTDFPTRRVIDFTPDNPVVPENVHSAKKNHPLRNLFRSILIIAVIGVVTAFYLRYFNPYIVEARTTGYVTEFEKRGIFFKTFEGIMATEKAIGDTAGIYDRRFTFTVPDEKLARRIQALSGGKPRKITLVYEKFYGMLPWRGGSTNVVTDIIEN